MSRDTAHPSTYAQVAEELAALGADSRVAILATIPGREDELRLCLSSLCSQMDAVAIVFNYGKAALPAWLLSSQFGADVYSIVEDNSLGDAMKFRFSEVLAGWQFTCDDDLIYPPDYASYMIGRSEHYGRRCVVSLAGAKILPDRRPVTTSYYHGRKCVGHCLRRLYRDASVNVGGTGVMCFHSSLMRVPMSALPCGNMADVHVAVYCQRRRIPMVCLKHGEAWLRYPPSMRGKWTIWDSAAKHDRVQADFVNQLKTWQVFPADTQNAEQSAGGSNG